MAYDQKYYVSERAEPDPTIGRSEKVAVRRGRPLSDTEVELRAIVRDTLWMAQRYADGRMTYAVSMFNDALERAQARGLALDVPRAKDGMFDK